MKNIRANKTEQSDDKVKGRRGRPPAKAKKEDQKLVWKPEYQSLLEKLEDIFDIIEGDINTAKRQFRNLDISKYESFDTYIYNSDVTLLSTKKGTNERAKMLRAKRKNNTKCPNCGAKLVVNDSSLSCDECGYFAAGKSSTPNTRSSTDNNKHTLKQLDAVIGKKKPPANILKIINHIATWLTDMRFIRDWLVDNDKLSSWMDKFYGLTHLHIDESFFETVIERVKENKWQYDVFKLFTDELYLLLEKAKRLSKIKSSNMNLLTKDQILDIFTTWYDNNDGKLPNINDKIKCVKINPTTNEESEIEYEVGLYINQLRLQYESADDSIKNNLEEMFGQSLTMPGLMFNFNDIYEQGDNVPKKYNYQQEFIYIIHSTFNAPFANICHQDITNISELILKFNSYYKEEMLKTKGKQCNAPLFCCTLVCIIQNLPYFEKYQYVEECLPTKDRNTLSNIKSNWFKFMCSHEDIIRPYMEARNDVIKQHQHEFDTTTTDVCVSEESNVTTEVDVVNEVLDNYQENEYSNDDIQQMNFDNNEFNYNGDIDLGGDIFF